MGILEVQLSKEFPFTTDCLKINDQIDRLIVNESFWRNQFNEYQANATQNFLIGKRSWFEKYKCLPIVEREALKSVDEVLNKLAPQDRTRIEDINKKQTNVKLIFGGVVLSVVLLVLLKLKK
jgi:uncharacterized protein YrrD